jgi:hypothetical protein
MRVKEYRLAAMFAVAAAAAAIVAAPIAAADTGEPDNPDITSACFDVPDSSVANCATPDSVDINVSPDVLPADINNSPDVLPVDQGGEFDHGPTVDAGGGDGGAGGGHR